MKELWRKLGMCWAEAFGLDNYLFTAYGENFKSIFQGNQVCKSKFGWRPRRMGTNWAKLPYSCPLKVFTHRRLIVNAWKHNKIHNRFYRNLERIRATFLNNNHQFVFLYFFQGLRANCEADYPHARVPLFTRSDNDHWRHNIPKNLRWK